MTVQRQQDNEGWKVMVDTISKFLIPFLVLGITWQQSQVQRLEDRIYALQATSVTEAKLQNTKQEIIAFVDTRIGDLHNKLDLVLRQMELQQKYNK